MPLTEAKQPIAQVNIAGYDWEVYFGYNHGGAMKVYSFLPAQGNIYDFRADVKLFFSYLTKEHQFPAEKQYMLGKFFCYRRPTALVMLYPAC